MATQKLPLDWMYEGPSSAINREDFLTGKKIDKNFEKSNSDFHEPPSKLDYVIQNKTLAKDSSTSNSRSAPGAVTSALLDLETIKKEDPLVAIKVREEKMRREILENPVKMKRLQKIVMKSMEKKMKKFLETQRRRSGRSGSGSSSESEDESSSGGSARKESSRHSRNRRQRSGSSESKDRRSQHRSEKEKRSSGERRDQKPSSVRHRDRDRLAPKSGRRGESGERQYSRKKQSPDRSSPSAQPTDRRRGSRRSRDRSPLPTSRSRRSPPISQSIGQSRDSHRSRDQSSPSPMPRVTRRRHDSPSSSDSSASSDTTRNAKKYGGYGLIQVKERKESKLSSPRRSSPKRDSTKKKEPEKASVVVKYSKPQKPAWKPLSEEEMEKRRQEMTENAKWRDDQRKRNLRRLARDEDDRAKRDVKQSGEAVDFIRSMVASSTDHSSVEGRVKSKIQRLQRSAGSMETSFVRK